MSLIMMTSCLLYPPGDTVFMTEVQSVCAAQIRGYSASVVITNSNYFSTENDFSPTCFPQVLCCL